MEGYRGSSTRIFGRAVTRIFGRAVTRIFGRAVTRIFGRAVTRIFGNRVEGREKLACGEDRRLGYSGDLTCGGVPAALWSAMIWHKHSMPYSVKAVTPSSPRP